MQHPSPHIFEQTPETLSAWCAERGWPKFRAKQVFDWVYAKGVADPLAMSNLKPAEREQLAAEMHFLSGDTVAHQVATDGTQKLLIEWREPGVASRESSENSLPIIGGKGDTTRQTECVMIPAENEEGAERKTACISSQVGCPVGCRFCASGIGGLDGNLSTGRIVEQVWRLARLPNVGRISNVVFMGMGEPLSNFKAVTDAIRRLAAPTDLGGMGISARKITISTVGLPQAIERLAEEMELPVTLALSLHAPNDEIRRDLIPWANYTTIKDLLAACSKWFSKTGREITLEYIMLGGINDQKSHAEELAQVARMLRANVNLIRYNEVAGMPFSRPRTEDVRAFQDILREKKINVHIRASRGRDIAAACGQLRHEKAKA